MAKRNVIMGMLASVLTFGLLVILLTFCFIGCDDGSTEKQTGWIVLNPYQITIGTIQNDTILSCVGGYAVFDGIEFTKTNVSNSVLDGSIWEFSNVRIQFNESTFTVTADVDNNVCKGTYVVTGNTVTITTTHRWQY